MRESWLEVTVFPVYGEHIGKLEIVDPSQGTVDRTAVDRCRDVGVGRSMGHDPMGPGRSRGGRGHGRRVLHESGSGHRADPRGLTHCSAATNSGVRRRASVPEEHEHDAQNESEEQMCEIHGGPELDNGDGGEGPADAE